MTWMTDVDPTRLRSFWAARQGLDGSLADASSDGVLARVGWARSVGGCTPYLTLRSRAGIGRDQADADVAGLRIHELPAARDCTYVLPAADFGLAAAVGGGASSRAELRTAEKLGVTAAEVESLADDVLTVLREADADPAALRRALGDRVRSLGDEGKRKGITTTLPLALGLLQADSRIRRVPVGGRLDQQRFRYTVWDDAPRFAGTADEARAVLAERYWTWIGAASLAQFRWFSAFTATAARTAVRDLGLVEVPGSDLLTSPDSLAELAATSPQAEPAVAFVGWLDSLVLLRRDLDSLVEPADRDHPLLAQCRGAGSALGDLPHQGIFDRGRLVGLWDFDPDAGEVVAAVFPSVGADVRDAVATGVGELTTYVVDQLGDVRGFSLDSPASRRGRLDGLRAAG
jgi:hypothetical protein